MKSCFFIGHREATAEIFPALMRAVEQHITEYGVTEFFVGNYGAFDRMAARAVIAAKKQHPEILLFMLIPYHPSVRPVDLLPGFENTFYPPGMEKVPGKFAIPRANRYMIDHTDHLIAYVWHPASNARNLLDYAQKRELQGLITVTTLPRAEKPFK